MPRSYFGTDGVRGRVGHFPLTVDFALHLASAAARVLAPNGGTVLVGKDTRLSGYMFESALEAGFVAAGVNVVLCGPLPTPAIAHLTKKLGYSFGAVISASHNPYDDNGIKFFDASGRKLDDAIEAEIERALEERPVTLESSAIGSATRLASARIQYQDFLASLVPKATDFTGLDIVIDCAHGAAYKVGPRVLQDLGATVTSLGTSPNGRNINLRCGSTSPQLMQRAVPAIEASLGIALDGDADRLVMADSEGNLVDGDQILYVIAKARQRHDTLRGPVVGTVMSNFGLEEALATLGIEFVRAQVGDRYVLEQLRQRGGVLGGEASGHILCLDRVTSGDALAAAIEVLSIIQETGQSLAELVSGMTKYPQVLQSVRLNERVDVCELPEVQRAIVEAEDALGGQGREVLRSSGTEPVVRVMVEAQNRDLAESVADTLSAVVARSI